MELAAEDVSPVAPKKKKAVDSTPVPKKATKSSKSKKAPEPEPEPTPEDDDEQTFSEEEEEEEKKILKLAGVDGDEDEDDEADETLDFKDGDDVGTIPAPPPTKKGANSNDGGKGETGVVYIGHIPHGFFENQLRSYFTQFGDILVRMHFRQVLSYGIGTNHINRTSVSLATRRQAGVSITRSWSSQRNPQPTMLSRAWTTI